MQIANSNSSPTTQGAHSLGDIGWLLAWVLVPVAAVFLVYPSLVPWTDEVQFIDPGASWFFGQGFTSSTWPYQRPDELFMGNAPAFSALLGLWFEVVGFGWTQARGLSFLFAALAAGVSWIAYRRAAPAVPAWLAGMVVALAFCGYGVTVSLWSARYDTLGMLLAALLFLLLTYAPTTRGQQVGLVLVGAGVFLSGFHLVIACVLLALVLYAAQGRRSVVPMFWLGLGVGVGALFWLGILAVHGQLKQFVLITFGSQHTVSGQLAQLMVQGDRGFMNKLNGAWRFLFQDPSWLVLMVGLLLVAFVSWREMPLAKRLSTARLSVGLVLVIPIGLLLAGKFPAYYVWMGYFPTAMLMVWWSSQIQAPYRRWVFAACAVALIAASVVGMGRQLQSFTKQGDPQAFTGFERWTAGQVQPDDWVYSGFEAYPAARLVAQRVFVPTYGQTRLVPGIPEANQVTLMLVHENHLPLAKTLLGNEWVIVSRFNEGTDSRLRYSALRRSR